MPNHYETLGVSKDASEKEIKQAFRAMSMKFHPDKVKTKTPEEQEEANRKMQEINSANDVLSDKQQREIYDMELNGGGQNPFGQGHPFGPGGPFGPFGPGGPFGQGGPFGPFGQGGPFGQEMRFSSGPGGVNIFEMLFGQGGPNIEIHGMPGMIFQRHIQKPSPIVKDIKITLKQAYTGTPIQFEIERWVQEGDLKINESESFNINVPQGIDNGETIILQLKGNVINAGDKQIQGDVHLNITVSSDESEFVRKGIDLYYKKTITLKEALCGFKFKMDYINGNQITLNVNVVLFTGAKQVIKNLGMVREGTTGNLILEFDVKFPESLTPEQKEALSNIL